ncbi:ARABIDILLO 1-like isoform X1, partial [Olea europaea subsp. europaea]
GNNNKIWSLSLALQPTHDVILSESSCPGKYITEKRSTCCKVNWSVLSARRRTADGIMNISHYSGNDFLFFKLNRKYNLFCISYSAYLLLTRIKCENKEFYVYLWFVKYLSTTQKVQNLQTLKMLDNFMPISVFLFFRLLICRKFTFVNSISLHMPVLRAIYFVQLFSHLFFRSSVILLIIVALAQSCSNASHGLQERAAGALWGLSVSEVNSIAIGRGGGVAPLIALAQSNAEDVHETAAGAIWNLAFNPGNALRIVEEGGVPILVHLCSSSVSKMARFMSALALAYMFDGRMDEIALRGTSTESTSKSVSLDGARKMALKNIEAFVLTFSDPRAFSAAAASSAPTALTQVTESAQIQEAGHLRCSGAEIGRFVAMLRNPSSILKACAAFALLQFTIPGGRHAQHHVGLLQNAGAPRVLRASAAATGAPLGAKIFARIVLRNLEQHQKRSLV